MRVLVICNSYPDKVEPHRGPFISEQVKWLAKRGVQANVVKPIRFHITRHMLTPNAPSRPSLNNIRERLAIPNVALIHGQKTYYPKVVVLPNILFTWCSGHLFYLQCKALFSKIFSSFKPDIIHSHFITPNAYVGHILSKRYSVPHITSVMGDDARHYAIIGGGKFFTNRVMENISGVIVKSTSLKNIIVNNFNTTSEKVKVIFNGVDLQKFFPKINKGRTSNILFIGSFYESKDILGNLLPALKELKERRNSFMVHFVGDGVQKNAILKKISELNLRKHIVFHGRQDHQIINKYFDMSDVLVLSSFREGTPNVLMESIAAGVPVVACAIDGNTEIVTKDCGILVPPRHPQQFAAAIEDALTRNWNTSQIRQHAEAHFDIRNKVREIIEFYSEVLTHHGN